MQANCQLCTIRGEALATRLNVIKEEQKVYMTAHKLLVEVLMPIGFTLLFKVACYCQENRSLYSATNWKK